MQTEGGQDPIQQLQKIYIKTYQSVFYRSRLVCPQEEMAKELFILTYVDAYKKVQNLPRNTGWDNWILEVMDQVAISDLGIEEASIEEARKKEIKSERRGIGKPDFRIDETSLFLEIEDRISVEEQDKGEEDGSSAFINRYQNVISGVLVAVALVALITGVVKIKQQLDIFRKPLVSPFESEQESQTEPVDIRIKLGGKVVYLSEEGKVLYSLPLSETDMAGEKPENPEIQKQAGWTYYLPCPEREDTRLSEVDPSMYHTLYRMRGDGEEMEVIAREVDNYTFWEDGIYISQYGRVQRIGMDEEFEKKIPGLYPLVRNDEIYLYDTLGRTLLSNPDGSILYEDRKFMMSANRIDEVKEAPRVKDDTLYFFKDTEDGHSKEIYKKTDGSETVYESKGLKIDSFCIVGNWLYYSAYIRNGGSGAHYSELYRKSLTGDQKAEKIREEFTGRIWQMYYSEENGQIYANYSPKNWKSNHGVIAVISVSGQMSVLEDEGLRRETETTGNDTLEFIMARDNEVYCYWSDCYWERGEDAVAIWRKILVIPDQNRIPVN